MRKTELAIATDFAGEDLQLEKLEKLLERISKAGFTHIHWCHEWEGDYMYSHYEMQQIREWMDKYNLKSKALHATKGTRRNVNIVNGHYRKDFTSDWEYNRKAGVELIKNRVDLAACLGAEEIVLHFYLPHMTIKNNPEVKEKFYVQVCKSLDELMPYCLEKKMRICLENLFDMPGEYVLEQWDRLLPRYPEEFLGLCVDTGHAYMSWGKEVADIIRKYADRIHSMHLHDNNGTVDFHMLPGEGQIDWKDVMDAFRGTPYKLPLTMELVCHDEDIDGFLKKAYEIGQYLTELYMGTDK